MARPLWVYCECNWIENYWGVAKIVALEKLEFSFKVLQGWYQMLQEDFGTTDVKIGGEGIVVEIDESKFEGVWVVGGVEKTPERRCFMIVVPNRNQYTLRMIIQNHVLPGSIVYTDCWRGYVDLQDFGLVHATVNHNEGFSINGVCTNTIEGTWNGVKFMVPPRLRTKKMMPWMLVEFIWRRKHHADIFGGILKVLKDI